MARSTKAPAKVAEAPPAPAKRGSAKPGSAKPEIAKSESAKPKASVADARVSGARPRLATPTDLGANTTTDVAGALNTLLADFIGLYMKTKNFHWHVSGPHFRDYHLMFDEQAAQILATFDTVAERVRKIGGTTLRSTGHVGRLQRLADNDADYVEPREMLTELREDNKRLVGFMRDTHELCDEHKDVATASLLENWIDEAEERIWFLYEASRQGDPTGH